jgi:hypothetical protein
MLAFRDSKNRGVPGSRRADYDIPTGKYGDYPCPFWIRPWAREGLTHVPRRVMGCHLAQDTTVQNPLDDDSSEST